MVLARHLHLAGGRRYHAEKRHEQLTLPHSVQASDPEYLARFSEKETSLMPAGT